MSTVRILKRSDQFTRRLSSKTDKNGLSIFFRSMPLTVQINRDFLSTQTKHLHLLGHPVEALSVQNQMQGQYCVRTTSLSVTSVH